MPFHNFKRQGFFAVSITVLGLATQPSFASPASELIDNYNAWYLENGIERASYTEVVETGDTTEIRDYTISGVFTSKNDAGKPAYTFYVDINLPKLIFKNSKKAGNVYSYQSLDIESATYEFGAIESDKAFVDLAAAKAAEAIGVFSGQLKDYTINDYSEEWADHPNLKENVDQDALLGFLRHAIAKNYGETTLAEMTIDANLMSEMTYHSVMSDYKSSGSEDGKTDLTTVANYATTSKSRMDTENASSNVTSDTVTTYKNVKITDIDIRPFLAFFQLAEAPTAKYMGGYSAEDIKIEMSVNGAKAYEPIGKMVMSIASTSAHDLSISGGDGLKLLSLIDKLDVEGSDPSEETIFELFDALGTYSIGYSDMKDLALKVWDPVRAKREAEVAPNFEMTLASASMSDFSSNSLGSVKFEGLHGAVEGDDAVFDIGSIEIADIAWPSLKTMVEKGMMIEQDPNAVLEIIPTIGKFSITGVEAITEDLNIPVSLSEFTLLMENHIGPFPTKSLKSLAT